MIIKNIELVKCVNGLISLQKECNIPFSVTLAHKINRNIKKLIEEVEPYEEDRQKIMNESISDDEKNKKISELLLCETDIQLNMIDIKELEGIQLTLSQMDILDIMIKKEDE